MYFERKIDKYLDEWLETKNSRPALLVGIRQCGKTEAVRELAKRNNLQLIELNFWTNPEYCSDFFNDISVGNIISNISLRFPNLDINPDNSLFFLMKYKIVLELDCLLKILLTTDVIVLLGADRI